MESSTKTCKYATYELEKLWGLYFWDAHRIRFQWKKCQKGNRRQRYPVKNAVEQQIKSFFKKLKKNLFFLNF